MSEIKHITEADGTQSWTVDGELHRIDGPALIHADGSECWYQYGERHRLDGPAIIRSNGYQFWFINGNEITEDVENWLETNNITYPFTKEEQVQFILTFSGG